MHETRRSGHRGGSAALYPFRGPKRTITTLESAGRDAIIETLRQFDGNRVKAANPWESPGRRCIGGSHTRFISEGCRGVTHWGVAFRRVRASRPIGRSCSVGSAVCARWTREQDRIAVLGAEVCRT